VTTTTWSRSDRSDRSDRSVRVRSGVAAVTGRLALHRRSLAVLGPLLVLAAVWQGVGMSSSPQRIDDEGTYVAQAYAVQSLGALAHYTYFYDHPPLGWLQLAAYTWSTDAFERYPAAVMAGREAMLVVQLVSVVLLWVVARRLGMARWAAGLAVVLFSLSPLAVQFHRTVYLDNIATPWLLASFALALSPQRRLWAYAGSGLCFAVAVLTKETALLLLPALVWQLTRLGAGTQIRRYGLALAGSLLVLIGAFYPVYALAKGELLPGPGHVSLLDGLRFQLLSRTASGSIFQDGTLGNAHVAQWLQLDVVLPALALLSVPLALLVRRLRPLALGLGLLFVVLLRPGYLPVPYVIAMLPLAALLIAGVADAAARHRTGRQPAPDAGAVRRLRRRPLLVAAVLVGAVSAGIAAPAWAAQQRGLFLAPLDAPSQNAQDWITANVDRQSRLIVDDAFWVDLVRAGFPRQNVVWYYKVDTDPAVERLSPRGWRDYDYLVSTESVRSTRAAEPEVAAASDASTPVAVFGKGEQRIEVRQILPAGKPALTQRLSRAAEQRTLTGRALARNPGVQLPPAVRDALTGGAVDPRIPVTLAELATASPVQVLGLPTVRGETAAGLPARAVLLRTADPAGARELLRGLPATYAPTTVTPTPQGLLLRWPLDVAALLPVA